ncbi:hypothetical protein [Plastoroseomonas arctica]|uniref:DUF3592 domain-containing protein n=1 Tax=Plastoroseomonas arctica TaxID=1509237 RepID=A0AAF1JYD6_9PROT|nr:hypothetical protein [Plastoroseomonas arctica]MBR0656632.1 hypothetical protein [Plastoroseomonas arctica]
MTLGTLLIGGAFLLAGVGGLWRARTRRSWVKEEAVVIAYSPAAGLVTVSLGEPKRFGSLRWSEDYTPSPGTRVRVTHPPGDPLALRWHIGPLEHVLAGITAAMGGIVVLIGLK